MLRLPRPHAAIPGLLAAALVVGTALASEVPERWKHAWPQTGFSRMMVPASEIISEGRHPGGGLSAFHAVGAEQALDPREPVMVVDLEGAAARACPIRYLMWHEAAPGCWATGVRPPEGPPAQPSSTPGAAPESPLDSAARPA